MKVTTGEFIKNYGSLADSALNQPVTITKNGRDRLVVLSAEAYARLKEPRTDVPVTPSPLTPPPLRLEDFAPGELSLIAINPVPGGADGAPGGLLFVFVGVAASSERSEQPRSAVVLVFTREGDAPVIRVFPVARSNQDGEADPVPEPVMSKPARQRKAARAPLAEAVV